MAKVIGVKKKFIYRSIKILPSGKIRVKYTQNPYTAGKLGGVLTCRSCSNWQRITNIIDKKQKTTKIELKIQKNHIPTATPSYHSNPLPPHPIRGTSSHASHLF